MYLEIFGETLRELMIESNIPSALRLSQLTGVSHTAVSNWLKKQDYPSLESLLKLADFFLCPIDYFFNMTDSKDYRHVVDSYDFLPRFNILFLKKGCSRRRLVRDCGFATPSMVTKLECGHKPKIETLIKLSIYFNCSIEYLIGRSDVM